MKKILFPALWLLLVLGTLEAASGWWLQNNGNLYDRARGFVQADPELGWRQKPNWAGELEGAPVATNSLGWRAPEIGPLIAGAKIRLLVLGPASAFGWGVPADRTYAAEIVRLLRANGSDVIAVNAGEIDFSTVQGLKLMRSPAVAAFRPTHVLIAYGLNDLDRSRLYFESGEPDSRALAAPQMQERVSAYHLLSRSALLTLVGRIAAGLRGSEFHEPSVRVPPVEFAANLRLFAEEARRLGAATVFLATPVNLPRYTPQLPVIEKELRDRYIQAADLYRKGDFATARLLFEELAKLLPQWNEPYRYLAAIARANGQPSAKVYDSRATLSEPYRLHRDVIAYNALMKAAAEEAHATYVDLYAELDGESKAAWFSDYVHPTAQGHARIAAALVRDVFQVSEPPHRR